uniref:Uncharacterized protein n=1 Tax=Attheya septentrionalis TaxID=420275 RepID=A0A6T7I481_9STRA|mmetsp:Transcript_23977/g.43357  ORF Transcript_23977/g.43357 Transcript_23977/m.43357 type:complete len:837 (+) Transcript_23977:423-2933(+)|eukprot:CAMPEP_0198282318 /NCGR_PEP_ID=MMETSP1449-20131203/2157_1 /TAXON_ID=420275 /ORGANISM="Attheya septentrionalis, Strain CCMP2084" /LENGTH=836 /DNA_ID=CAMNT_0043978533 /DNA_START=202 /DNA_END=2712 /DNA_ORIENTATION=+
MVMSSQSKRTTTTPGRREYIIQLLRSRSSSSLKVLHQSSSSFLKQVNVPSTEIGDRVGTANENAKASTNNSSFRMFANIACLVGVLALGNVVSYITLEFAIVGKGRHSKDLNYVKKFEAFENPFPEIVRDTIPHLQKWYRAIGEGPLLPALPMKTSPKYTSETETKEGTCLGGLINDLQTVVPYTSPLLAQLVVQNLGLVESPLIRQHLQDLLTKPQALISQYVDTEQCMSSNAAIKEIACILAEDESIASLSLFARDTIHKNKHVVEYIVNYAAVVDKLTLALLDDNAALFEALEIMINVQRIHMENLYKFHFSGEVLDFMLAKYRSMAIALQSFGKIVAENKASSDMAFLLQMNILEAVKIDIDIGNDANARVGLALAASVQFNPFVENNKAKWRLGTEWVNAYIAWNFGFVVGSVSLDKINKLLIPSVTCTANTRQGEDFIAARVISLALTLLHWYQPPKPGIDISYEKREAIQEFFEEQKTSSRPSQIKYSKISTAIGVANLNRAIIASPSSDTVEKMLYELCAEECHDTSWQLSDTNPISKMSDDDFQLYVGFVIWGTVLIAGLGLELLVWRVFLQDNWTQVHETLWKFAQFAFPLLAATTLGLALFRNYIALPFLVAALWKFGFPETLLYMHVALYDGSISRLARISDFLNATGTVLHHGSASLLICMLLAGVLPSDRTYVNPILILLIQHWFVLLRYVHKVSYYVVMLATEAWFQWAVISDFESMRSIHWVGSQCAAMMLLAHWLYLNAAMIELLVRGQSDESEEGVLMRRLAQMDTPGSKEELDELIEDPSAISENSFFSDNDEGDEELLNDVRKQKTTRNVDWAMAA